MDPSGLAEQHKLDEGTDEGRFNPVTVNTFRFANSYDSMNNIGYSKHNTRQDFSVYKNNATGETAVFDHVQTVANHPDYPGKNTTVGSLYLKMESGTTESKLYSDDFVLRKLFGRTLSGDFINKNGFIDLNNDGKIVKEDGDTGGYLHHQNKLTKKGNQTKRLKVSRPQLSHNLLHRRIALAQTQSFR